MSARHRYQKLDGKAVDPTGRALSGGSNHQGSKHHEYSKLDKGLLTHDSHVA